MQVLKETLDSEELALIFQSNYNIQTFTSRELGEQEVMLQNNIKSALNRCNQIIQKERRLAEQIIQSIEALLLKTSQSSHKDIHRNALDSFIKIVDFSAGYFLSTSTIEIFSESINNQAYDSALRKRLIITLNKLARSGYNLCNNKIVNDNLQKQLISNKPFLDDETKAILIQ